MQFSYTEFCTCIELSVNLSIFVYIWVFIYVLTVNEITRSIVHMILKYFKDQHFTCDLSLMVLWAYRGEISKELSLVLTLLYFGSHVPQSNQA